MEKMGFISKVIKSYFDEKLDLHIQSFNLLGFTGVAVCVLMTIISALLKSYIDAVICAFFFFVALFLLRKTGKKFAILLMLIKNEGKKLKDKQLYEAIWNVPMNDDSNAIRKHIQRLKKKLNTDAVDSFDIVTLYGGGFVFTSE